MFGEKFFIDKNIEARLNLEAYRVQGAKDFRK
jgi:hypothetical protein